ncbi:hypothetical protein HY745_14820 [Candidatus Desantisbacteria bacterium]|nr:hypothetical protein [Candidatus Desantisbacteria bacterium]
MSLEKILEKINKEYKSKTDEIEANLNNKLSSIENETKNEIQKIKDDIAIKFEAEAMDLKKRAEIEASIYRKNILLVEKQNKINIVFQKVQDKFVHMEKTEYQKLIKQMIYSHLKELEKGTVEIFISSSDKDKINNEYIDILNAELKNKNIFLKPGPEYAKISGGFILKKDDMEINESWDMLFRVWKKEFEIEVAQVLFKGV